MSDKRETGNTELSAFLSPSDLESRWKVSKSLVYKIVHTPGFPTPLRLGTAGANGKSLRFSRASIEEWERRNSQ
jgi:predicted DNA-binding transcriptional regulator AlpA